MSKRRPIARAFFLVSLAVLLGSIFRFTWRQQYTCLGVPFLAASPTEEGYEYYDYSEVPPSPISRDGSPAPSPGPECIS